MHIYNKIHVLMAQSAPKHVVEKLIVNTCILFYVGILSVY